MDRFKNMCLRLFWALALLLSVLPAAHAGRTCEPQKVTPSTVARGMELASKTLDALNASEANVVLLARAGQDLTQYGLRYSHLGLAHRVPDGDGGTTWWVLHKLNACGTASSTIYRQGLGEFFSDTPFRYEAAWLAPIAEVQARLLALIQDPRLSLSLHHKPYSVVSYAWGQTYQQSNQWAIETLAVAMQPTITDRVQAQAWLKFKGYLPTTLTLGPLTRLGGRLSSANVAFDDHPSDKRFSNRIETVTVESVFQWLPQAQLAATSRPTVIRP